MRIMIFADIHGHNYREFSLVGPDGINSRLLDTKAVLDAIVSDIVAKKVEAVFFLGDLAHLKNGVDSKVIQILYDGFEKILRIVPVLFVPGNHDFYQWSGDAVLAEIFLALSKEKNFFLCGLSKDASVYGEMGGMKIFTFPFQRDVGKLNALIESFPRVENSIALFHQDIAGMKVGSWLCEKGLDLAQALKKFSYIFSGHFHNQTQLTERAWIVGSPLMLNFSAMGQTTGWLVFDTDTSVVESVINDFSPEFRELTLDGSSVITERDDKNFYRITVRGTSLPDSLNLIKWKRINFETSQESVSARASISLADSVESVLAKYVQARGGPNFDHTRLIDIGRRYL